MPHNEECPYCHTQIKDWFVEWYPPSQQSEIGREKLAMDCPECHRAVILQKRTIQPAPPGIPMAHRDYQHATKWAQKNYSTLEDFLVDPTQQYRAKPFRVNYWPNVNLPVTGNPP